MGHRWLGAVAVAAAAMVLGSDGQAAAAGRCGDVAARPWCNTALNADARAELLLKAMTFEEKVSLLAGDELTGVLGREGTHTGTSKGVPRVGMPDIYFSDGPVGTRQGKATGMPAPMALAASFDEQNAYTHATIVGDEVKKKGNDVVYAPAMNMLRTPLNGRTFEYFGEDPFLSARMAVGWTKGVQSTGVIANAKHYAVNNQEGANGIPPLTGLEGSRFVLDAQLDERTLREIYLPQFEAAVKEGGAGSIMCAYPRVNGQFACENDHLLEEILKGDWGFKGFVLTDYLANKSTANALNNGLDLDIFPGVFLTPPLVQTAVGTGQVGRATIDEHIRRQLRTLFAFGFFDRDAFPDDTSLIDQDAHHAAAADIEAKGIVLLRNQDVLPISPGGDSKIAVIGPEADKIRDGGGSSAINEFKLTTPLVAIRERVGASRVNYVDGSDRAAAAAAAQAADLAIVVVGDNMSEGTDKPCMGLNCGQTDGIDRDALVDAVAGAQPNTVVVLQSGGPVLLPWRDKVKAILEAWYPGQNGGTAIARVLFGDTEPTGRLPATFQIGEQDGPTGNDPEKYPGVNQVVKYKEGVLIGYRWFDELGRDVAYPFGFGLTYTSFSFGAMKLLPSENNDVRVSVSVTNTGDLAGTAVPQLYVGMPDPDPQTIQPPWQLKGFDKFKLEPGRSRRVAFTLDERAFSYWAGNAFDVAPGCYRIGVGGNSRDLPAVGVVGRGATCPGALSVPRTAASCTSRRTVTITLPRRLKRGARVTFKGRTAKVRRVGRRLKATINLRGLKKGRVTVKVRGRTANGKAVEQTRVFRTCTKKGAKG